MEYLFIYLFFFHLTEYRRVYATEYHEIVIFFFKFIAIFPKKYLTNPFILSSPVNFIQFVSI